MLEHRVSDLDYVVLEWVRDNISPDAVLRDAVATIKGSRPSIDLPNNLVTIWSEPEHYQVYVQGHYTKRNNTTLFRNYSVHHLYITDPEFFNKLNEILIEAL